MARSSTMRWNVRVSGTSLNGGGYQHSATSGTDYSLQTGAQISFVDINVSSTNPTWLWSVGQNAFLTSATIGNVVNVVSATNILGGYYQVNDNNSGGTGSNYLILDRSITTGSFGTSTNGALGGATKDLSDLCGNILSAGQTVYLKNSTYASATIVDVSSITILGYNTTIEDVCVGDNRPLIDGESTHGCIDTSNQSSQRFINLRFANSTGDGLTIIRGSTIRNCKSSNNASDGFQPVGNVSMSISHSESNGNSARGITRSSNSQSNAFNSYIHDNGNDGIYGNAAGCRNSIIESNGNNGIRAQSNGGTIDGSVIYNNTNYGTYHAVGTIGRITNTISTSNGTNAFRVSGTSVSSYKYSFDYNCYFGHGVELVNIVAGPNDVGDADPKFSNPYAGTGANTRGDFTLRAKSPCINAGMNVFSWASGTGDYKKNLGIDQNSDPFIFGPGVISRESGAIARGGAGDVLQMAPTDTTATLAWRFYIPVDNSNTTLSWYHRWVATGFNGTGRVTIYGNGADNTALVNSAVINGASASSYVQFTTSGFTPTAVGFCEVIVEYANGSTSGGILIDDITIP